MISGQAVTHLRKSHILNMSEADSAAPITPEAGPVGAKAVAEYSAEILTELRDLASGAGLTFLAYLIQVAVEESKIQAADPEQG
ncbi:MULTISPECIES: hypothetical protein [Rhodomicrobium]|uniref:hypothetical protein n=1 Tax=Rhodomicrobium TaxID=1068 RepID=UPI000B4BD4AC|nr:MULTISPECIES: hypothetical protein [Rhodomicrobium]